MAPRRSVAVVVLGDVGRSPRMQYHTVSLAGLPDTTVSLVGYAGERCIDALETHPNVKQYLLGSPFAKLPRSLFLLWAPLKVLYQIFQLFWTLLVTIPAPSAILVQNPPSIPALLAVWVACRARRAAMVIDWHNFGYSVLAHGSLGDKHLLVRVAKAYERHFARLADGHICVTRAMRKWLADNWGVQATVLYDKPPPFFRPCEAGETHDLFSRLGDSVPTFIGRMGERDKGKDTGKGAGRSSAIKGTAGAPSAGQRSGSRPPRAAGAVGPSSGAPSASADGSSSNSSSSSSASARGGDRVVSRTLLTEQVAVGDGTVATLTRRRPDRPALLVSSTSWTPDEDFGLLLEALVALDRAATRDPGEFPDFLVVVTGKGPQRGAYEARIAKLALRRVAICTLWLAPGDYPRMLGSADLGVCLHTSTSGLDLPMKVVDMFGAGLPVAAVGYACLPELLQHGVNGTVFSTPSQLAEQLVGLFRGFPAAEPSQGALARLRRGVAHFQSLRWQDNWDRNARELFA